MRGQVDQQQELFHTFNLEDLIPSMHPIRKIKATADRCLKEMDRIFSEMYSEGGRKSIPPERLLKSKVLMALFTVRSERQFCEQLSYNFLFRWFLDLNPSDPPFDHSSFSKNLNRFIESDSAKIFFKGVVKEAKNGQLLSEEHFSVDGSLIEAWASHKSFKPKDEKPKKGGGKSGRNPGNDFHGEKRTNDTHESKTDPDAKLFRKSPGRPAQLCYLTNVLMENRNGLCVDVKTTRSVGSTESKEADQMVQNLRRRGFNPKTLGADKGYHNKKLVESLRRKNISPHIAEITGRLVKGLDGRTTYTRSYMASQRCRKKIEEIFGWVKTIGNYKKTLYRGVVKNQLQSYIVFASFNLRRLATLQPG